MLRPEAEAPLCPLAFASEWHSSPHRHSTPLAFPRAMEDGVDEESS